jgi:hypothetical protein
MGDIIKKAWSGRTIKIALAFALISIVILSTVSCKWSVGLVRGSGDIVTEERDVSDFHRVNLSGIGDLIISQGDEESLTIEADDNIIQLIETDVSGGELTIQFKRGYSFVPNTSIKFYLMVKELDKISLSGAGKTICDNFEAEELEFDISGAGDIDFDISAADTKVYLSGAGDISLSGEVDRQKIRLSGVGNYNGKDLESRICDITVSGAGSATVNVSEELDVNISGVGNVNYTGSPRVEQEISGLGRIRSID